MNEPHGIFSVLALPPPQVSAEAAEAVALAQWGIRAHAKALRGERDRNFHLRAEDGREFVLKFANPAEAAGFRAMQIAALEHIARVDPELPVPRVVPLPDGRVEASLPQRTGVVQHARLLSWVPGNLLSSVRRSAAQRIACGRLLARLQVALEGFHHPSSDHRIIWDLQHALCLREVVFAIPQAQARACVAKLLDEFEACIVPLLDHFRRQILHNDMGVNTLVDPADPDLTIGVIDFGDIAETAVVFDVAIAAAAQLGEDMPIPEAIGHFVAGFHAARPLLAEELGALPLLVALRMAMGLTLASWHRHSQPDNPHFDFVEETVARRLAAISEIYSSETTEILRSVCGQAEPGNRYKGNAP
ncbi:MAG TPA: phosphotransferase [Acetobacteraceae bacterium]